MCNGAQIKSQTNSWCFSDAETNVNSTTVTRHLAIGCKSPTICSELRADRFGICWHTAKFELPSTKVLTDWNFHICDSFGHAKIRIAINQNADRLNFSQWRFVWTCKNSNCYHPKCSHLRFVWTCKNSNCHQPKWIAQIATSDIYCV